MRPVATAAAVLALVACFLAVPSAAQASPWRWPLEGRVITPYANGSDPYASGQHRGIDVAAPVGAPVVAASAGTVTFAGPLGSSGLTVAVRTDDGFDTSYLHLSSIAVGAGERVASGAPIGQVGTTGRRSAAEPHLHFGVREAGSRFDYRDPLDLLPVAPQSPPSPAPPAVPVGEPVRPRVNPVPALSRHTTFGSLPATAPLAATALAPLRRPAPALAPLATLPTDGAVRSGSADRLVRHLPAHAPGRIAPSHEPFADRRVVHAAGAAASRHAHPAPAIPAHGPSGANANHIRPQARAAAAHRSSRNGPGLDLGWLVACVALVSAAAVLGHPRATGRSLRNAFELPVASVRSEPDRP
jgi:hypothetical protein